MSTIERVGVSLDKTLLAEFDKLIGRQGYTNRSEAIRDLIRESLSKAHLADPSAAAVAAVCLVYDHHATHLSDKLLALQHNHLLHVIASTHLHLDHHNCMEVIMLKGKVKDIETLANNIAALKGVKLSRVNLMAAGSDAV